MPEYICQRCRLPLTVDKSLENLSAAQKHLLTTSYSPRPRSNIGDTGEDTFLQGGSIRPSIVMLESRKQLFEEALEASGGRPVIGQQTDSYVDLTNGPDKMPLNDRVASLSNVFNVISSKYEIDYPVCSECAQTLLEEMGKQFDQLSAEKETYVQFLKRISVQHGPNEQRARETLEEKAQLDKEEAEVLKELEEAEKESKRLQSELEGSEKQLASLAVKQRQCSVDENKYELELRQQTSELNRVRALYEGNMDQLDTLRHADVYADTFEISSDGPFGTINGLRLGSMDKVKVSWHEINAALGQVVLALSVCVRLLKLDLGEYVLVPMGSTSKIEKIDQKSKQKTVLEVFSLGEFSLGRIFTHNNLDQGMLALVEVIRRIGQELQRIDSGNELPFAMTKDKVAGFNICPSARKFNKDWTSACRYMLTNVKWILAFSVSKK